jgi:hypothetical protein
MRSSKPRSRSKSNRNRPTGGNIINRVFDSSGPEGKVRGTPQQIIDKYNQLTRDAQLSNDRVAAENFQQHAEHYLRLLSEAQRESDQRRDEQERQNRERQAESDQRREDQERQNRERQSERDRERAERQDREPDNRPDTRPDNRPADPAHSAQPEVLDLSPDTDSGLVETPESKPRKAPARPRTRKPKAPPAAVDGDTPSAKGGDTPEAAE